RVFHYHATGLDAGHRCLSRVGFSLLFDGVFAGAHLGFTGCGHPRNRGVPADPNFSRSAHCGRVFCLAGVLCARICVAHPTVIALHYHCVTAAISQAGAVIAHRLVTSGITLFAVIAIILWPMVTLVERSLATDDGYGWDNYRLLATSSGSGFAGGTTAAQALEH